MDTDPFIWLGKLEKFDGNPVKDISKWLKNFTDTLDLILAPLTEHQKLARLKICLEGLARTEFDKAAPKTLNDAIAFLQKKYNNYARKSLAREKFKNIRQLENENIFEFASRLEDALRSAFSGETEEWMQKRMFEEFLDRLIDGDLAFQLKAKMPKTFEEAYDWAIYLEQLSGAKKLEIEHLATQMSANKRANKPKRVRSRPDRGCFYCKDPNHRIRDCCKRMQDEGVLTLNH
jgi:hypothetical protein